MAELQRAQAGLARSHKHEQGVAATEAARGRKLAVRAAATLLLSVAIGAHAQVDVLATVLATC